MGWVVVKQTKEHLMAEVRPKDKRGRNGNTRKVVLTVMGLLVLVAGGIAAYIWVSGGTAQASGVISAPALQGSTTGTLFHIVPDQSQVRFFINETLLGQPKTVVGATNQVAGDIRIDRTNPAASQVGTIRINARTLATDNEIRNRALRGQILLSNRPEFEFIAFVPTKVSGLPSSIQVGEPVTFQLVGNLTVRDVTREVTFATTVTLVSDTRLEGIAQATIRYQDFAITIPNAPGVANVGDAVRLEIMIVAQP
jgi:polyisoprenoid-binding protein YceI